MKFPLGPRADLPRKELPPAEEYERAGLEGALGDEKDLEAGRGKLVANACDVLADELEDVLDGELE